MFVMNKIANFLYQFLWFFIVSPFYKKKLVKDILTANRKRFKVQIMIAVFISSLFNIPFQVLIGDSNSEIFANFRTAIKFNKITVTLGIGGTTPDGWLKFLTELESAWILKTLQVVVKYLFWNIGGNSVLQGKMETAEGSLKGLQKLFQNSFNFLAPPVHASILKTLGTGIDYKKEVERLNSMIQKFWKVLAIDIFSILKNPATEEAWFGTLADPVHYSDLSKNLIISFINGFKK